MKLAISLFMISLSADAFARAANEGALEGHSLSGEYNRISQASHSQAVTSVQGNFVRIIVGEIENKARARVASAPEVKMDTVNQIGTWFYRMDNKLICSVPVAYSNNGLIVYVWGDLASCK